MSHDQLLGQGITPAVATKLVELQTSEVIKLEELDDRAVEALKEFSDEDAIKVVEQFSKCDLAHVTNKSAYLCGVMKTYRVKMKKVEAGVDVEEIGGPDEEKIKQLLEKTGYTLEITTGQRKYGGPPPGWEGPTPGCGEEKFCSQVFIGKIPRDMYEDELVPMFDEHGTIYEFRLMVDSYNGQNKGFAFCTYTTKEGAQEAVKALDKKVMKDGKILGVCISLPNNRLFVGSIPKSKSKEEIMEEFKDKVEEMTDVIVYADNVEKTLNRGFAFLEFNTHKDASVARKKLMGGKVKVFGNITPTVDWAEPQEEPDEETMAKVKTIYIKNLTAATDDEKLKELFKEHGEIASVKKVKDYAFLEFAERDSALKAIEAMNGQELESIALEISLAKPMQEKKRKNRQGMGMNPRGGRGARGGFRGRGAPRGAPRGRGGAPPPFAGGYGYGPYAGYGDGPYDNYYQGPPMRGGRGGPRGMPPRGGFRGGPWGMPPRGRGAPGRGMPPRGGAAGAKRKMENGADPSAAAGKKKFGGAQGWTPQPIAQQPLSQGYYGGGEWYHDSYNQQW